MTGRGSGAPPPGQRPPVNVSFTERYAPPKPPRWRRILSLETAQSVLTFIVAVALVALVAYLSWISIERSGRLADPPPSREGAAPDPPKDARELGLTSADGTAISAWSLPAEAKKSATAVILAHDVGGDRGDVARLAAALRARHDVIALDLRGHGASDEAPTTLGPAEAEDVRAAIEAAVEAGDGRVALVGVGLGASAVLAAAAGDSRVDAIVAVAPWPHAVDSVTAALQADDVPLAWPADWATLVALLFRTGRDVTSADVTDTVTRTTAPILVVAGTDDPFLSDATLEALGEQAPDLTTWQVDGDREAATEVVQERDGIERIVEFIDAAFEAGAD